MMKVGSDEYKAAIVGYDEDKDVAVLKIALDNTKVGGCTLVSSAQHTALQAVAAAI